MVMPRALRAAISSRIWNERSTVWIPLRLRLGDWILGIGDEFQRRRSAIDSDDG
jgi:hypothetical protein